VKSTVPIGLIALLAWAGPARPQAAPPGPPGNPFVPPAAAPSTPAEDSAVPGLLNLREELAQSAAELQRVGHDQAAAQDPQEIERLKKQMELLQKQIEVLQRLVDLLRDQLRKQTDGVGVERLEARSVQAAQRDRQLANAVDDLREHIDADERWGPWLPAPLKELFLPTQTNESPLSVYGVLVFGYTKENDKPGGFKFGEFSPQFLLLLNDRFLLEGEITVGPNGSVSLGRAQVDWLVNDHTTLIGGLFESPIGFFNERLNHPWFNKFPDTAVFFRQVSPGDLDMLGVQARGAFYLGCSPVKLEYNTYVANALATNAKPPGLNNVANLEGLENPFTVVNNDLAYGGRVGLWVPALGLTAGVSLFHNGNYLTISEKGINLIQFDAGFRQGNWDLRCEYGRMHQHAAEVIGNDIYREGLYAQVSYRPYDAGSPILQKAEVAFRYSYARFHGLDPTALDLTIYDSSVDAPVNRNQYTFGLNYYVYPSMVLKLAYEINQELEPLKLNDNVLMAQFAWGF
jgi:hypothetical protein